MPGFWSVAPSMPLHGVYRVPYTFTLKQCCGVKHERVLATGASVHGVSLARRLYSYYQNTHPCVFPIHVQYAH